MSRLLAVDDHLAACGECRGAVAERLSPGRLPLVESDMHLEYEDLEALAEGRGSIADLELHQQHVLDCERCAAELQDLRAMVAQQRRRWRFGWQLPAAAAVAAGIAVAIFLAQPRDTTPPTPSVAAIQDGMLDRPEDQRAVAAALEAGRIEPGPGVRDWNRDREQLLGSPAGDGAPAVIAPVGVPVESDRPVFRWTPVKGAASYRVEVYDSAFNEAATSPALKAMEWTPDRPLLRGAVYSWVIAAQVGGREIRFPQPPAPEARFEVVSDAAAAELAHARQASSRLLLAIVAGRYGLWTEALAALDEAARLNPSNAAIARLRESVRARVK